MEIEKILIYIIWLLIFFLLFNFIYLWLWNWICVEVFGWVKLTYWQMLGLRFLINLLNPVKINNESGSGGYLYLMEDKD